MLLDIIVQPYRKTSITSTKQGSVPEEVKTITGIALLAPIQTSNITHSPG